MMFWLIRAEYDFRKVTTERRGETRNKSKWMDWYVEKTGGNRKKSREMGFKLATTERRQSREEKNCGRLSMYVSCYWFLFTHPNVWIKNIKSKMVSIISTYESISTLIEFSVCNYRHERPVKSGMWRWWKKWHWLKVAGCMCFTFGCISQLHEFANKLVGLEQLKIDLSKVIIINTTSRHSNANYITCTQFYTVVAKSVYISKVWTCWDEEKTTPYPSQK